MELFRLLSAGVAALVRRPAISAQVVCLGWGAGLAAWERALWPAPIGIGLALIIRGLAADPR